ncbi:tRNA dihydrouridine synthase DusB [candidate division KSB1 bacterium]|nr:tRNA dihydrouridine synthase DusB [candidate division KSB1 bacterium]
MQAPLAGISNIPFRLLCREFGARLLYTEMISADGIKQKNHRTLSYLKFIPEEHPIAIQIFGHDARIMAEAVKMITPLKPDYIDINMGCPARKVVKRGAGAALLKNTKKAGEIVEAVIESTPIPVTVKIRSGWDQDSQIAVELSQLMEEKGVAAIIVHPRSQSQQFKGQSDWAIIRQVKAALKIPVIGNGDIKTPEDAMRMLETTNCDGIMIGRAAIGYPWIFKEIRQFLETGVRLPPPTDHERLDVCLRHFNLAVNETRSSTVESMRKQIGFYTRGMPQSTQFRAEFFTIRDAAKAEKRIRQYQETIDALGAGLAMAESEAL